MNRHVNAISGRLSLRSPQRDSLEILARVLEIAPPEKDPDLGLHLDVIRSEFPSVTDFERQFPSLCFALATGVGKTRLMGAFISYLFLAKDIRHFFVLAPNLTIYNKLIADFTPGNPKYVLQGIAEFATTPPEIITGDNYEGRGGFLGLEHSGSVHINIFNISKINSEVRGGSTPRIKRLSEYIGKSYFDYLAGLDDLVLLMDESHRYRASAGVRAINELKPILGLELTATPQTEMTGGRSQLFKNVIYSYPLSTALKDGFVKEPAVATRENFRAENYSPEALELLKLEDGIRVHESAKVELEVYARQNGLPIVKPFMLVVAQDTEHANALTRLMEGEGFFEGRYKGKVITVHSNQRGEEKDETVQRLLSVESPDEPTEVVVHVNMLKEGWDVTNLYTIVPLRAASSRTLVEQSIGRGLRLPYGKRVGVAAVDRLTIIAHDKFQAIIDEANRPDSIIRTGVVIGRDIPIERKETILARPRIEEEISPSMGNRPQPALLFTTPIEQEVAKAALLAVRNFERLPRSADLKAFHVQAQLIQEVQAAFVPSQRALEGVVETPDFAAIIATVVDRYIDRSIDIPRIVLQPKGDSAQGYAPFDLDVRGIHLQPVSKEILIHHLGSNARERLVSGDGTTHEERPEDYLVSALMDFMDISYDEHADLLYGLAGQMVRHLRSYLNEDDSLHVLQFYRQRLAEHIHVQMQNHWHQRKEEFDVKVSRGFTALRDNSYSAFAGQGARDFRAPVDEKQYLRGMVFEGFKRCLYSQQKFDSDAERRFAVMLENEADDLKWFKPAKGQFQIYWHLDQAYEPDFVVETRIAKYLCEPKRASELSDGEVQEKARAAVEWCQHATAHERMHGGKPWTYLLIPHDAVTASSTLDGLVAGYAMNSTVS